MVSEWPVQTSTDAVDKMEAVEEVRELSKAMPLEVGEGLPALMATLRECNEGVIADPDCASTILEVRVESLDSLSLSHAAPSNGSVDFGESDHVARGGHEH
jgi:hypothetical protein